MRWPLESPRPSEADQAAQEEERRREAAQQAEVVEALQLASAELLEAQGKLLQAEALYRDVIVECDLQLSVRVRVSDPDIPESSAWWGKQQKNEGGHGKREKQQ